MQIPPTPFFGIMVCGWGEKGLYTPSKGWTDQMGAVFDIHELDQKNMVGNPKRIFS